MKRIIIISVLLVIVALAFLCYQSSQLWAASAVLLIQVEGDNPDDDVIDSERIRLSNCLDDVSINGDGQTYVGAKPGSPHISLEIATYDIIDAVKVRNQVIEKYIASASSNLNVSITQRKLRIVK